MLTQEVLSEYKMEYSLEDFTKYKRYLNTINEVLEGYFENQKEYICCQKGCAHCCEKGQYPISQLEFNYLILGFFKLDMKKQQEVIRKIQALKEEYSKCEDKDLFMYRCPFLGDDNLCSVYEFRALICRTFGLITLHENGAYTLPFCNSLGLNYSKVYNPQNKKIDYEKVENLGSKEVPQAHRTDIKRLMSPEFFEDEPLDFGEIKSLIDWL